ncbi:MAG TPA: hypothetical protein VF174_11450 [Micromonosporaceae bacterium]
MDEISNAELSRWLTRVEAKLDKALEDHERRLRRLERLSYVGMGVAAAGGLSGVSALLSAAGGG